MKSEFTKGTCWPVDTNKVRIEFDAGKIVDEALEIFTDELALSAVLSGTDLFTHEQQRKSKTLRKLENVPCLYVDTYEGKFFGEGSDSYAITPLEKALELFWKDQDDDADFGPVIEILERQLKKLREAQKERVSE